LAENSVELPEGPSTRAGSESGRIALCILPIADQRARMHSPQARWGAAESSVLFLTETGQYGDALSLSSGLNRELEPSLLLARAHCFFKKGQIIQALDLLQIAEKKDWVLPDVFAIKGRCLFALEEYRAAKAAFEQADQCGPSSELKRWIRRCDVLQDLNDDEQTPRVVAFEPADIVTKPIKYEWYQTRTHLSLGLFVKDLRKSQLRLEIGSKHIHVIVDDVQPLELTLNLIKELSPQEDPQISITAAKVEIKFAKASNAIGN
jgi:tetratricopeptide (TPR) repeat protein